MSKLTLSDILAELAGPDGVRIDWDEDHRPFVYRPSPQPDMAVLEELLGYGWLSPAQTGRGLELSREGFIAYMRSTDEMGDGKLVRPFKTFNPNPGSPHQGDPA